MMTINEGMLSNLWFGAPDQSGLGYFDNVNGSAALSRKELRLARFSEWMLRSPPPRVCWLVLGSSAEQIGADASHHIFFGQSSLFSCYKLLI